MFSGFQSHTLAALHYYDSTDCSAFHAAAILKTFEIRPGGLLSHVFTGSIDILSCPHIMMLRIAPHFMLPQPVKTFEIRPGGLLSHVFTGSKVMRFHVNMKRMTF